MATPLIFSSFFFMVQDVGTNTIYKPRYELAQENLLGVLTYLLHTWSLHCWATKLQVCGVQVSFRSHSLAKMYQDIVVGVALMFIGITCPLFFSIST